MKKVDTHLHLNCRDRRHELLPLQLKKQKTNEIAFWHLKKVLGRVIIVCLTKTFWFSIVGFGWARNGTKSINELKESNNNGSHYIPRHIPPVQLADIKSRPTQYLPPFEGEGLVHERRRWCLQSGPQLDQLDQAFHRPSTTFTKKKKEKKRQCSLLLCVAHG